MWKRIYVWCVEFFCSKTVSIGEKSIAWVGFDFSRNKWRVFRISFTELLKGCERTSFSAVDVLPLVNIFFGNPRRAGYIDEEKVDKKLNKFGMIGMPFGNEVRVLRVPKMFKRCKYRSVWLQKKEDIHNRGPIPFSLQIVADSKKWINTRGLVAYPKARFRFF